MTEGTQIGSSNHRKFMIPKTEVLNYYLGFLYLSTLGKCYGELLIWNFGIHSLPVKPNQHFSQRQILKVGLNLGCILPDEWRST